MTYSPKKGSASFPKVRGGSGNSASYGKPVKNRAKFVKKHAGKTVNQLSSSQKGM